MNATYLAYGAEASLSMADANLEGVKTYDPNRITAPNQIVTVGVCVVAATSLLTGLFAMYIEASVIACLAFVFPLITGPMVISQRRKIQWIPTFQEECNKMRLSVNELAMERNRLEIENARLERQMKRLSAVEGRFDQIVTREGHDLAYLKNLVKQNGDIQRESKKLQAAIEMQDLISLILKSDKNGDNRVSEKEMGEFLLRLKHFGGRRDRFNEDAVKEAFRSSLTKTVQSLLQVTASMMEDGGDDNGGGGIDEHTITNTMNIDTAEGGGSITGPNKVSSSQSVTSESKVNSSQQQAAPPVQCNQTRSIEMPVIVTDLTHVQSEDEEQQPQQQQQKQQQQQQPIPAAPVVFDLTQVESMDFKKDLYVPDGEASETPKTSGEDFLLAALLSSNSAEFEAGSVSSLNAAEVELQSKQSQHLPTSVHIPNKAYANL